ncbi:MAG: type II toxin-antitoxin system VapC family toxin [Opitutaceae bacterium]
MLFDTTFFIDMARELREPGPGAAEAFLIAHRHRTRMVSVVTIGEFSVGATRAATLRFFRGFHSLALGRETAIFAGRLQSSLGLTVGENDLWIAATALRSGVPLVSRDAVFEKIPGLRVLEY